MCHGAVRGECSKSLKLCKGVFWGFLTKRAALCGPFLKFLLLCLARTFTRHRIASTTLAILEFLSAFRAGVHSMKDEELGIHRSLVCGFAQ